MDAKETGNPYRTVQYFLSLLTVVCNSVHVFFAQRGTEIKDGQKSKRKSEFQLEWRFFSSVRDFLVYLACPPAVLLLRMSKYYVRSIYAERRLYIQYRLSHKKQRLGLRLT